MAKFDVESFYDYCTELVKNNIAAKVDEVNADKGDGLTIQAPTVNQFVSDFNEQLLNENFFIYYTLLQAIPIDQAGHSIGMEVSMLFYACFVDNESGDDVKRKAMRYTRSLNEIFQDGFNNSAIVSQLKIIQHFPQSAQFENSTDWYKIGGVELKGIIIT